MDNSCHLHPKRGHVHISSEPTLLDEILNNHTLCHFFEVSKEEKFLCMIEKVNLVTCVCNTLVFIYFFR